MLSNKVDGKKVALFALSCLFILFFLFFLGLCLFKAGAISTTETDLLTSIRLSIHAFMNNESMQSEMVVAFQFAVAIFCAVNSLFYSLLFFALMRKKAKETK